MRTRLLRPDHSSRDGGSITRLVEGHDEDQLGRYEHGLWVDDVGVPMPERKRMLVDPTLVALAYQTARAKRAQRTQQQSTTRLDRMPSTHCQEVTT